MKKLVIMAALATLVSGVFADTVNIAGTDVNYGKPSVGTRYSYNWNSDQQYLGLTVGTKFDKFGVEGSFDRSTTGATNLNQWGLIGSYDVVTYEKVTLAVKGGAAYQVPSTTNNGWVGIVGLGVSYPIDKGVNLVADYSYQSGSSAVAAFNGNVISAGVKFSF